MYPVNSTMIFILPFLYTCMTEASRCSLFDEGTIKCNDRLTPGHTVRKLDNILKDFAIQFSILANNIVKFKRSVYNNFETFLFFF